jgi:hypothetical protein
MPSDLKTVNIFNVRKLRPDTVQAIVDAPDGGCIGADPEEMRQIVSVTLSIAALCDLVEEELHVRPKATPKKGGHRPKGSGKAK